MAIPINPDAVTNGEPTSVVQSIPVVHNDEAVAHVSTVGTFLNLNRVVAPIMKKDRIYENDLVRKLN